MFAAATTERSEREASVPSSSTGAANPHYDCSHGFPSLLLPPSLPSSVAAAASVWEFLLVSSGCFAWGVPQGYSGLVSHTFCVFLNVFMNLH